MKLLFAIVTIFCALITDAFATRFSGNPILPDSFADPAMMIDNDTFYIYSTTNCGTVWYSKDFINWKHRVLNWPTSTKMSCQWAPCIRKVGKFYYLYYSLNSQIYAAKSTSPFGPFTNMEANDAPFIKDKQYFPPTIHSIDADLFIDDNGKAYLYWGSGWNFKNGLCAAAELNKDMHSFKTAPKNITPKGYFEGPHMMKRDGKYYLMYSDGVYTDGTYCLKYSVSDSPMGPFEYGKNNPILITDKANNIYGPGHHYTAKIGGKYYIIYHKLEYPRIKEGRAGTYRQICIDELLFDEDGAIKKVKPTSSGIPLNFISKVSESSLPLKVVDTKSSKCVQYTPSAYEAPKAFDGDFGTLWESDDGKDAWICADLGSIKDISAIEPFFASIRESVKYKIEYSEDAKNWNLYVQADNGQATEWPQRTQKQIKARYIKLTFIGGKSSRWGLWELKIFGK